jgi:3-oxoacyl-[acyl-carrier-protein] synthase-3
VLTWDEEKNGRTAEDLYMDGLAIFMFSITKVHKNINALLELVGWEKDDVDLVALHQANQLMVETIGKKLKVAAEKVPVNVKNYGNTGPASIPLLLSDKGSSCLGKLQRVVLSGFGVGLSLASMTCDLSKTIFYEPINR